MKAPRRFTLESSYIQSLREKAKNIPISEQEAAIVNKYTSIDAFFVGKGNYKERKEKMWLGKVKDYKFFVALLYEESGQLPKNVRQYMEFSPCGQAKLQALKYRANKENQI